MLSIFSITEYLEEVKEITVSVDRLDELVTVFDDSNTDFQGNQKVLIVNNDGIHCALDWHDTEPPYNFGPVEFSEKSLLALIFFKIGNHQKAFEYIAEGSDLYCHFLVVFNLLSGQQITGDQLEFLNRTSAHNCAVVAHYGNTEDDFSFSQLGELYEEALKSAENDELKIYSAKHFISLLLDNGLNDKAMEVVAEMEPFIISEESKVTLLGLKSSMMMAELTIPYDRTKIREVEALIDEAITYYEKNGLKTKAGLMLIDASELANFQDDYVISKELISRAITYFKEEEMRDFLGEATVRKAVLLYTWSKNGSPQYYKPSINAYQDALKVFKRDTHPQKFADIHHNLAIIYSEIPVGDNEFVIWSAFSASSFKEAHEYYNKADHPYEYAMICNNYGIALMNYPPAKIHDNHTKAAGYFEEALEIRTKENYPFERAITLLNQLKLFWSVGNESKESELEMFNSMMDKANEVKTLVDEEKLIVQADENIELLNEFKDKLISN